MTDRFRRGDRVRPRSDAVYALRCAGELGRVIKGNRSAQGRVIVEFPPHVYGIWVTYRPEDLERVE